MMMDEYQRIKDSEPFPKLRIPSNGVLWRCLFSCGPPNYYNHPSESCSQRTQLFIELMELTQMQKKQPSELGLEQVISGKDAQNMSSNPFKFDANPSQDEKMFGGAHRNSRNSNPFALESQEFVIGGQKMRTDMFLSGKVEKTGPESIYDHNIKKYKKILGEFYNRDYSQNRQRKHQIPELAQQIGIERAENQSINLCFKATRLAFCKEERISKSQLFHKNEDFYLTKQFDQKLVLYQLKQVSSQSLIPIWIELPEPEIFSSICYESTFNRIYCFSNKKQKVIVIGTKSKEVICQLPLKHHRMDPVLFIHRYKAAIYLMVIGGYEFLGENSAEGSKYIEIFQIEKWEMSLNQVILKINVGRIQPIVFTSYANFEDSGVYVMGGHTNIRIRRSKKLDFTSEPTINNSTNQTGIKIESELIMERFENDCLTDNQFLVNNINVRFQKPTWLYGGQVLCIESPKYPILELFLPTSKSVFEIKIVNNDVNIKETEHSTRDFVRGQLGYHQSEIHKYTLYCIGKNGEPNQVERDWNQIPSSSYLGTAEYPNVDSKLSKLANRVSNTCVLM